MCAVNSTDKLQLNLYPAQKLILLIVWEFIALLTAFETFGERMLRASLRTKNDSK